MRRAATIVRYVLGVAIALPLLLLAAGNTDPGRRALESLTAWASGGTVRLSGLGGRFPDALRIERLELLDQGGVYATVTDAAVDWSPFQAMRGVMAVDRLGAARVAIDRLPVSATGDSTASTSLPLRLDLKALHIDRLVLGAPVAGAPAELTLDATGAMDSLTSGHGRLQARNPNDGGTYSVSGSADANDLRITADVNEPAGGLVSRIADLPNLGAIVLHAGLEGPWAALKTQLNLTAGQLHASAAGQIDLTRETADLTVEAAAPPMQPAPDLSWRSISVNAQVRGAFSTPNATGRLRIEALTANGFTVDSIAADLSGNAGEATLTASLSNTKGPDPVGSLLAATPIQLQATARLDTPDRPVRFTLRHPLLTIEGNASATALWTAHVAVNIPELAPLAGSSGWKGGMTMTLDGSHAGDTIQLAADGSLNLTAGPDPTPALLGNAARFHAAGSLRGQAFALSEARIAGRHITATAQGSFMPARIALKASAAIDDLGAVRPNLSGALNVNASLEGPPDGLTAHADLTGSVTTAGVQSGPLQAHLEVSGLPTLPEGTLTASGALLGTPLSVLISARRDGGTIHTVVERADWQSTHAEGSVDVNLPNGRSDGALRLSIGKLDDFSPLVGQRLIGNATMTLTLNGPQAQFAMAIQNGGLPGTATIGRGTVDLALDHLPEQPTVDATFSLDGFNASGVLGSASLRAKGGLDAMALTLTGSVPNLAGAPLALSGTASLDAAAGRLTLRTLEATWRRKALRLLAPAQIDTVGGLAIDKLRLGLDQAALDVSGRIAPVLGVTAVLRNLPASLAAVVNPDLDADGSLSAEARLTGDPARPDGTIKFDAVGLRLRQRLGHSLPVARIGATATLAGGSASVDVRAAAGSSHLTVTGRAPLSATGSMDLRAAGILDLGLVDPVLAANGQHVAGTVTLNASIGGTMAAPRLSGDGTIAHGEVRDDTIGARIQAIQARFGFANDSLRLIDATGQAGSGSIALAGTIGVLSADVPLDLTLTARKARILASDAMMAVIDADLTLHGTASDSTIAGRLHAEQVDIRVPETVPVAVATIAVIDPAQPPPPPVQPGPAIGLNLAIDVPSRVFVRGRGLDAELGGTMQLHGTVARPQGIGGLTLRRGTIAFAGQTLTFTKGSVGFNGASLTNPALDLVSTTSSAAVSATLTVSGTAHSPTIALTSVPELPQDEILAQLLFKRSASTLSPFETAQIAAALASLAGVGPDLDNPLTKVRKALGLDRLSVGSGSNGNLALEAGRYVAPGIYVGAKQGASGGSQATVQIDIAKGLKLEATTGMGGGGSATGQGTETNGSTVGIGYEFEY